MFQYAAARAVALRSGANLALDLSWFATVADRSYALAPFNVIATTVGPVDSNHGGAIRLLRKVAHRLTKRSDECWQGRPIFREKYFHFDPDVVALRAPVCMDGYFQSEKYFSDSEAVVASEFTLVAAPAASAQAVLAGIMASDAICVHVRRGDYVASASTNAFHGTCSLDYYYEGLRIVGEGLSSPHCFVFSDDPGWVRSNFIPEMPLTIVDINGPDAAHEDLRLMAACKHFVIANSSLSWWGAWLGKGAGKRVVAPKHWFQSAANDTKDLLPAGWVRL